MPRFFYGDVMMSKEFKKNCSVRMSQELYLKTKETALRSGLTVGETVRSALAQINERELQVRNAKIILSQSRSSDVHSVFFSGNKSYVINKMNLHLHKNAYSNMQELGEKVNETVMEFMRSSMSDGTLLSKCKHETIDGSNIVSFKVHIFNVYCEVGAGQITILSVS